MNQEQYPYQTTPVVKNAAYYRARAREALKGFYGFALLAALIATILGGTSSGVSFSSSYNFNNDSNVEVSDSILTEFQQEINAFAEVIRTGDISYIFDSYPFLAVLAGVVAASAVVGILFSLFVSSPVAVGYQRYNLNLMDGNGQKDLATLFRYFKVGYGKTIGLRVLYGLINFACGLPMLVATFGMLWLNRHHFMDALTGDLTEQGALGLLLMVGVILLASLVTVVLQIVVQYRYHYCFMILAEYPEISVTDALRNSASLMRGNKWRLFCMQISFIGWILLAVCCTCGIGMFFLAPYMNAADAAFYDDIANRAAAREAVFPSLDPNDYINGGNL